MAKPTKKAEEVQIDVEHIDFDVTYRPNQSALEIYNKDPEFDYRWVRNDPGRIRLKRRQGYTLCSPEELDTINPESPDGTVRAGGELVAMKRPQAIAEKHKDHLRQRAYRVAQGAREAFKTKAERVNVSVEDTTQAVYGPPLATPPDPEDD